MQEFLTTLKQGIKGKCPACLKGNLFQKKFDLSVQARCKNCDLDFAHSDSADGPAVFLIFILGFLLVPAALIMDILYTPPIWLHIVLWGGLTLIIGIGALRPLKSYIIYLQYKYRKSDWDKNDDTKE